MANDNYFIFFKIEIIIIFFDLNMIIPINKIMFLNNNKINFKYKINDIF